MQFWLPHKAITLYIDDYDDDKTILMSIVVAIDIVIKYMDSWIY